MPEVGDRLLGAIDIGSSAIRMDVAEVLPDGKIRVLESLKKGVQLGKDAFTQGFLGEETIRAACDTLRSFKKVLTTYGVARYRAVATSAVRESENREMFLDRVLMSTGLDVGIVDGPEENRLTYTAVLESLREYPEMMSGKTLLVEVGGGSTDVTLMNEGELLQSGTFAIGSIRLRASINARSGTHDQQVRAMKRQVTGLLGNVKRSIGLKSALNYIAVGGDVRFAARAMNCSVGPKPCAISRDQFSEFVDSISRQPIDSLVQRYSISYLDAETLAPALWIYLQLLKETQAVQVSISDASIRAGVLQDLSPSEQGQRLQKFTHQILSAARSLGTKYQYDESHAERVRELSELIFDELKSEQHMTDAHRLYLQVAALLHDVGHYVSSRGHHKHSWYLISSSDLFGLRQRELDMIANIARYHRKALPQRTHTEFVVLEREDRMVVSKLAAIVRVANALAKEPFQTIRDLKVTREGDQLVITAQNVSDLSMERSALAARSDLFMEAFGKNVVLREAPRTS
jgi:exopolyphosphatase/guanosine-5'-triphosphate,3'-diphosphate pyrophosphatase